MSWWRVFPDGGADPHDEGGALWVPLIYQGDGRHDNPTLYGALYAAGSPVTAVTEVLAPFRGSGDLSQAMLFRNGRPLALAEVYLDDDVVPLDLDSPATLAREGLRPSAVATRDRRVTQRYAASLFLKHQGIAGITWWSTLESSWTEVTFFDLRVAGALSAQSATHLTIDTPFVQEAARFLGLR
jgi:hypothetical protein